MSDPKDNNLGYNIRYVLVLVAVACIAGLISFFAAQ